MITRPSFLLTQATTLLIFVFVQPSPPFGGRLAFTTAQVVDTNSSSYPSAAPSDQPSIIPVAASAAVAAITSTSSDAPSASPLEQLSTNPSSSPTDPIKVEANIVGGNLAAVGEFDFFAWAYSSTSGPCGGTLIFDDIILTAASCGCDFFLDNTIYIGGTLRDGSDALDIAVASKCLVHPDYIPALRYNDIMLLKLVSPSPAPIVTLYAVDTAESFDTATAIGYGYTDYLNSEAFFLRKIETTILPDDTCEATFMSGDDPSISDDFDPDYRTLFNLCAASQFGGLCDGDGGGPLLIENNIQVGIFSYAIGLNECGAVNVPAGFTQVSQYTDWIIDGACGK
jgi:secreted trypsin-like serine protease